MQGNTCDFVFTIMPLTKTAERSNSSKFDVELTWQDLVRRQVVWSDLTRVKRVQKLCPYNTVVCFKESLLLTCTEVSSLESVCINGDTEMATVRQCLGTEQ